LSGPRALIGLRHEPHRTPLKFEEPAILEREVQRVRTATPGSRNGALNIAAFLLGKLAGTGRITERHAWDTLQTAAQGHIGLHGFTQGEINRTIRSGMAAGIRSISEAAHCKQTSIPTIQMTIDIRLSEFI
jgi:hypothetical protein